MRAVVVVVLLALLTSGRAFELYVSSEGGEAEELRIPAGVARALSSLSAEKREILSVIARSEGCTAEFVAGRTGKSLKTVRNHLSELKKMSLISSTGRRGGYKLTSWGRAVLGRYE